MYSSLLAKSPKKGKFLSITFDIPYLNSNTYQSWNLHKICFHLRQWRSQGGAQGGPAPPDWKSGPPGPPQEIVELSTIINFFVQKKHKMEEALDVLTPKKLWLFFFFLVSKNFGPPQLFFPGYASDEGCCWLICLLGLMKCRKKFSIHSPIWEKKWSFS